MRAVRLNTMRSLPALAIVLGCAAALLDLPTELWKGLAPAIAIYTVVASPVNFLLQRRTMTPIAEWLDARCPTRAHGASVRRHPRVPEADAQGATISWIAPTVLISLGMELCYADLWTAWDSACSWSAASPRASA